MHSSISSSSPVIRVPAIRSWPLLWGIAVLCAVLFLAGIEVVLRAYGHQPSVSDDMDLWAYYRDTVYLTGEKSVVLLGNSRMELDFNTDVFRQRYPDRHVSQLALSSSNPLPTLIDLANDEAFDGIVLCSFDEAYFVSEIKYSRDQQEYVNFYHRTWSLDRKVNRALGTWIESNLVFPSLRSNRTALLRGLAQYQVPEPSYLITNPDRTRSADYSRVDVAEHRATRVRNWKDEHAGIVPSPEEWLEQAIELEPYVQQIQARGGKVVFIKLPSSGELYELDADFFPKELFWDRFAAQTSAVSINVDDVPSLSGFVAPDESHLDYRDTPSFTTALLDELERLHVLD